MQPRWTSSPSLQTSQHSVSVPQHSSGQALPSKAIQHVLVMQQLAYFGHKAVMHTVHRVSETAVNLQQMLASKKLYNVL